MERKLKEKDDGDEYSLVRDREYGGVFEKLKFFHNKCGKYFETKPVCIITLDSGCPYCSSQKAADTRRRTVEEIKERVKNDRFDGHEYEFIDNGKFKTTHSKVDIRHNICGNIINVRLEDFFREKTSCKFCNGFLPFKKIFNFLNNNKIKFKTEVCFSDCVFESNLRFDFQIFKDDGEFILLEYDGRQHFEPVDYFGGEEDFKLRVKRDKFKNLYCKEKGIKLIRIPYYEFNNLEKVLEEKVIPLIKEVS